MTIVNHDTGELIEVSYGDVKRSVAIARESGAKFFDQIVWQVENRTWLVLGYADWDEMREAEYGDIGVVVPRADRPELVQRMRRAGMTQQDIAETIGVSLRTVESETAKLRVEEPADGCDRPATVINSRGQKRPTTYTRPEPKPAIDHVALADAAVAEFPDLAYYRDEATDLPHCWQLAEKLREYRDRGELDERLGYLRRSIEIARAKKNGTYVPTPAPVAETKTCPTCGQKVSD